MTKTFSSFHISLIFPRKSYCIIIIPCTKGPDGTAGFRAGWTSRVSKFVSIENPNETTEDNVEENNANKIVINADNNQNEFSTDVTAEDISQAIHTDNVDIVGPIEKDLRSLTILEQTQQAYVEDPIIK